MAADSTVEQMRNMKKYLKLCEVLLIGAVLLVIVGVLLLPIVFYVIKKAAQHEPVGNAPTCAKVTAYSGGICRDELLSLQTCFSDVTSPPPAETDENDIMSLVNGLSLFRPSQQCREAILPFLCIFIFNLCDNNNTLHTILREDCLHIRDDVCAEVWQIAVDYQVPLPVCENLPDVNTMVECIDSINQTTASSDNQTSHDTTPNRLQCSDGFYFDENGSSLCLPACGEWKPFPFITHSVLVFSTISLVSSTIMVILALTVRRDTLLVFPSVLVVYMCGTLILFSGIIIVGYFGNTALFCKSMNYFDSQKQGNETEFCIITGIVYLYTVMQTTVWTALDTVFFFWAIMSPFSYQRFKLSGRIRIAHIISVLLGLLVPLPAPLINLVNGYKIAHFYAPVIFCTGYVNIDYSYFTWLLPISIFIGITTFLQIYIIWTLFKEYVLKKLLNLKENNSQLQIGKVEVKLILLSVHYNLIGILIVIGFAMHYVTGDSFRGNQREYFLCESNGGSGCQQYLSDIRTVVIVFMMAIITWLLTPVMIIFCKINVFKNCSFMKTCFKKQVNT